MILDKRAGFSPKRLTDGRAMINLGCGTRMHRDWNNLDFSVYARLRRHMLLVRFFRSVGVISPQRFPQFSYFQPDMIVWDLKNCTS